MTVELAFISFGLRETSVIYGSILVCVMILIQLGKMRKEEETILKAEYFCRIMPLSLILMVGLCLYSITGDSIAV